MKNKNKIKSLIIVSTFAVTFSRPDAVWANGSEELARTVAPTSSTTAIGFQHGPYVGLAGGIRLDHHEVHTSVSDLGGLGGGSILQNFDIDESSATGGMQFGYWLRFAKYYHASFEGDVLFGSMSETKSLGISTTAPETFETRFTAKGGTRYGVATRLGGYWNQALLYLRFGVEWQRFKIETSSAGVVQPPSTAVNLSEKYTKAAFVPGVGLEIDLLDNLSLGLEYRKSLYSKKKITQVSGQADVRDTIVHHKPHVDSILIRLNYKLIKFGENGYAG